MKKYYMISLLSLFLLSSFSSFVIGQEPPYLAPIDDQTAMVGELFTFDVDAINADPAETYELTKALPGMTINSSTGLISWTPASETDGGLVTVRAYNSIGESVRSFLVYLSDAIVCSDDLISYWKMDETSGSTYLDFKGGFDATGLTATTPVSGQVDGAQLMEPEGQTEAYFVVSDEGQYDFNRAQSFSVSMWFNFKGHHQQDLNNHVLMARGLPENDNMCMIMMIDVVSDANNPKFTFQLRPQSGETIKTVTPNVVINENTWYHVVAIYNGAAYGQPTSLSVYINNQQFNFPHTFSDNDFIGDFDLYMGYWGAYGNTFPFNGSMDEILFYKKALSSSEVNTIYQDGLNGVPNCKPGNYFPLFTSTPIETANEEELYEYTLMANDFDDDPLTMTAEVLPTWLDFNETTGLLSGTPGDSDIGEASVKLKVTDGTTDIFQEFTITVNNVNDPPEITSTPTGTTIDQGDTFTYTLEATDGDPDDVLTLSAPTLPSWMTFNPTTGVLEGTATNDQVQYSPDSTFDVVLKVTDEALEEDTQEFTITVNNINDAPEVVSQSTIETDRNVAVDISLDDLDVDDPDNYFPSEHTFTILAGDDYTFSGNTITPDENFYGDLSVNTRISDPEESVDYVFTITVNYVNIAPEFTSTEKTTANEGSLYSYLVQFEDPDADDPDISQEVTLTAETLPNWLTLDAQSNLLAGIPGRDDVGDNIVSLKLYDGEYEVFQNFTIVVISGNNAPVITSSPNLQVNNYSQYSYTMMATDADPQDELTYSAVLLPSWLSFDPATQVLSGIPEKANVGTNDVILKVTDGYDEVTQEFTITVLDVNTAPVVTSTPEDTARAGSLYTYLMEIVDYENDNLTLTPTLIPAWLSFDIGSRVLSGTPSTDNIGEHSVIITVTDGMFTINHQFNIRVIGGVGIGLSKVDIASMVYPNPATDYVTFKLNTIEPVQIEVTDITGKVVFSRKLEQNTEEHTIDLSGWDKGIYLYRLSSNKDQQSGRIIIR